MVKKMARNSAKTKAKTLYLENPKITFNELKIALDGEVLDATLTKYLIEFRTLLGTAKEDCPTEISISKLEKELATQLERNPNSSVIKSCIDFLKLKQITDDTHKELDMSLFIKKGEGLLL